MNTDYFSVNASKVFHKSNGDGMFTREQLIEKRRKAERCANCPYPDDCHICPYDIIEEYPEIADKLVILHANGNTDGSIGRRLRLKPDTVAALRTVLGLEENVKAGRKVFVPTEDPCVKCKSKPICKAHNGTCNERVRWESK